MTDDGLPDDDIWNEFTEEQERDLMLHIAKLGEHMEWENTLPEKQKSQRRLVKLIARMPNSLVLCARNDCWSVFLGELERIMHHTKVLFGENCLEDAARRRSEWFERMNREEDEDDFDDQWWKGEHDEEGTP